MKLYPSIAIAFALLMFACADEKSSSVALEGTWELLSETKIEKGDTTFTPTAADQKMIKIINKTHFAFLRHDLKPVKDSSSMFVAGGGTYTVHGNLYKEHLEFFALKEWENHDFEFRLTIRGDTLIQQGEEKVEGTDVNRYIIERYCRVKGKVAKL